MQISKLVMLILKIFIYSAAASAVVFFAAVYVDTWLVNVVLPAHTHVYPTFDGAVTYGIYNSIEMSLFFTTFILIIIRLSIVSGTILTIRDIVQYYKKFIITTLIILASLACTLCVIALNVYTDFRYLNNVMPGGYILTYTLPVFWFILAAIYYKGYQNKLNEPDGSKDRSWLEGNIER